MDGVKIADFDKVVDHCYLCDLLRHDQVPTCRPTRGNVDFPHHVAGPMVKYREGDTRCGTASSPAPTGQPGGIPVVAETINAVNRLKPPAKPLQATAGIHAEAWLPDFASRPLRNAAPT